MKPLLAPSHNYIILHLIKVYIETGETNSFENNLFPTTALLIVGCTFVRRVNCTPHIIINPRIATQATLSQFLQDLCHQLYYYHHHSMQVYLFLSIPCH